MSYLRANLPPAIVFAALLCIFGYLIWAYPSPWPDTALFLSTCFCLEWGTRRNNLHKS